MLGIPKGASRKRPGQLDSQIMQHEFHLHKNASIVLFEIVGLKNNLQKLTLSSIYEKHIKTTTRLLELSLPFLLVLEQLIDILMYLLTYYFHIMFLEMRRNVYFMKNMFT